MSKTIRKEESMDPLGRLVDGYTAAEDPDARPRRRLADAYQPSAHYENLLRLKQTDPAAWRSLPATEHIAAGMYQAQKDAFEQLEDPA